MILHCRICTPFLGLQWRDPACFWIDDSVQFGFEIDFDFRVHLNAGQSKFGWLIFPFFTSSFQMDIRITTLKDAILNAIQKEDTAALNVARVVSILSRPRQVNENPTVSVFVWLFCRLFCLTVWQKLRNSKVSNRKMSFELSLSSFVQANDDEHRQRLLIRVDEQRSNQEKLEEILRYVELELTPPFLTAAGSLEAIRSILHQNIGGSLITVRRLSNHLRPATRGQTPFMAQLQGQHRADAVSLLLLFIWSPLLFSFFDLPKLLRFLIYPFSLFQDQLLEEINRKLAKYTGQWTRAVRSAKARARRAIRDLPNVIVENQAEQSEYEEGD